MKLQSTDLVSLFEQSLKEQDQREPERKLEESGIVVRVGDESCKIHGLTHATYGELVEFEGGNQGIVLDLAEDHVTVFLLYTHVTVAELETVHRTEGSFKTPVGEQLLGRVINAIGRPIDGIGSIQAHELRSVEAPVPGIVDRTPVDSPLQTGMTSIDALVPIGKGQRELLIGNRNTGKTTIAVDTILHQKHSNVKCVFVSVGQRQANLARIVRLLEDNDALSYTTVISADASEPAVNRYLAPYAGCAIAEYLRDQGHDVLVVYDDLSNHAIAYREISLLMRRPPGREAYPGDVFYLHSRLLERAGNFKDSGSITALPIVQVQGDDITAYIPTNLISITDGQVFLDTRLVNAGVLPAVNAELSVSRVGGAAQTKAMKQVAKTLRLELAQYHELLGFAQFGTELDPASQQRIARGERIVELFKQSQHQTYTFVDQVLQLFLLQENMLDDVPVKHVNEYAQQFVSFIRSLHPTIYENIEKEQQLTDEIRQELREKAYTFKQTLREQ